MPLTSVIAAQVMPTSQPSLTIHDIKVPEAVSNLPVALGWWLVLFSIIALFLWLFIKITKDKRLHAARKQALSHLNNNLSLNDKDCIALLKWSAMQYFDRDKLANNFGQEFKDFLCDKLPLKQQQKFIELISSAFEQQYQKQTMASIEINSNCQQATRIWLTHALPPIKREKVSTEKVSANVEKEEKIEKAEKKYNNDNTQETPLTQKSQEKQPTVNPNTSPKKIDIPLKKVVEETKP
jgi:hypothetical protein